MTNRQIKTFLCAVALTLLAVPVFGQATAVQPCQQTTRSPRARLLSVDASVPADPDVEKIIAPYSEKVISDADLTDIYAYLESLPKTADYKTIPLLQ